MQMFDQNKAKAPNSENLESLTDDNSGTQGKGQVSDFNVENEKQTSDRDAGVFLKYNFLAHMALDVFASPLALSSRENLPEGVILLFIQDDVVVYGMETNNGLKVVVGMDDEMVRPKLVELFTRIHRCYIRTVCNPFSEVLGVRDCENMLQTDKFDAKIREAIQSI